MRGSSELYRDAVLAARLAERIKAMAPPFPVTIMHVCGTHEWAINHYGLRHLLPESVQVIAGPGCPVCVTPAWDIDVAVSLAKNGVGMLIYGDMAKAIGSQTSLEQTKAEGADVRIVYSPGDAVATANREPHKEFVFFAIGFETTAPATALEIVRGPPPNLSFLVSHRRVPPAMELLLGIGDLHFDGYIAPGHVSAIIGEEPYCIFPEAYRMPTVIAGFEPVDMLLAIYIILRQVMRGEARLENEYRRVVRREGNIQAQKVTNEAFETVDGYWRGIGRVPYSGLRLREEFAPYDALKRYGVQGNPSSVRELLPGCRCHLVMIGKITPPDCPLFTKACTPESPQGPCMVSLEGTCLVWSKYRRREVAATRDAGT